MDFYASLGTGQKLWGTRAGTIVQGRRLFFREKSRGRSHFFKIYLGTKRFLSRTKGANIFLRKKRGGVKDFIFYNILKIKKRHFWSMLCWVKWLVSRDFLGVIYPSVIKLLFLSLDGFGASSDSERKEGGMGSIFKVHHRNKSKILIFCFFS